MKIINAINGRYIPPYPFKKLPSHLQSCPIHMWRATTGIELIHEEPDLKELQRIWKNWQLMTPEMKNISDRKSMELFGLTNERHYYNLLKSMTDNGKLK